MLKTGIEGKERIKVTEENTAKNMGSGELEVFATPAMIALMEKTSWKSVEEYLDDGMGTVGISLEISHVSATPLGSDVMCESKLIDVDGKKLTFEVRAYDEAGLIGEGKHERFIVENEKFLKRAQNKSKSAE